LISFHHMLQTQYLNQEPMQAFSDCGAIHGWDEDCTSLSPTDPQGLLKDSLRTSRSPQGVLQESLETPHPLLAHSLRTPLQLPKESVKRYQRNLQGVLVEFPRTSWGVIKMNPLRLRHTSSTFTYIRQTILIFNSLPLLSWSP
jgi:hypothetical protein